MDHTDRLHSVLMVGLTDAGKTNFLSRLWIALDNGKGSLIKDGLPTDLQYLQDGAEHLLKGEFAPRTQHGVEDRTEIPVRASTDEYFRGMLIVPDVPGEQVMEVYRTRKWSDKWENRIRQGTGVLIFIRVDSDDVVAPMDWVTCPRFLRELAAGAEAKKADDGSTVPPTQVVLVDWLQFFRKAFSANVGGDFLPRVGIVVSAWDRVPEDQKASGPEEWVRDNLPMLWQFVSTNDDQFNVSYFGVSLVSGDLNDDAEFQQAYLDGDPTSAGAVLHCLNGTQEVSSDMTLPVAWAMGLKALRGRSQP